MKTRFCQVRLFFAFVGLSISVCGAAASLTVGTVPTPATPSTPAPPQTSYTFFFSVNGQYLVNPNPQITEEASTTYSYPSTSYTVDGLAFAELNPPDIDFSNDQLIKQKQAVPVGDLQAFIVNGAGFGNYTTLTVTENQFLTITPDNSSAPNTATVYLQSILSNNIKLDANPTYKIQNNAQTINVSVGSQIAMVQATIDIGPVGGTSQAFTLTTTDPAGANYSNPLDWTGAEFQANDTADNFAPNVVLPANVPIQVTSTITLFDEGTFSGQIGSSIDPFIGLTSDSANDFTLSISPLDFPTAVSEEQPVIVTLVVCSLALLVTKQRLSRARG